MDTPINLEGADQPRPIVSLVCTACGKTFGTAQPHRHLCPACNDELNQWLSRSLTPSAKPDQNPLQVLYWPRD
jgi:hypothetical protein